ncbi:MAG: amidohydrolase family protein [Gammaproteobacteria bacterium]|nr:amidohydrolase family protein [Gammaproteobacteria bacterium]
MTFDKSRRVFLQGLGSAGIAGISGCCTNAPGIVEDATDALEIGFSPLAPASINSSLRLTTRVIDPHCHLFNASDVQVGGYLAGPIANNLPSSIRWLVKGLAPIVEAFAKNIAISAYKEMQQLNDLQQELLTAGLTDGESVIDKQIDEHRQLIAKELAAEIQGTDLERRINEHLVGLAAVNAGFSAGFSERYLLETFRREDDLTVDSAALLRDPSGSADRSGSIFAFVAHMLSPRYHNLRKYQKAYSTSDDAIGIDTCLASLVDFDYWLGSCDHPVSHMRDQIILHQRISELSNNYMYPIVAYNPWTDIKENDASLTMVVDAVKNRGFKGVKIYPPMGYFPRGNAGNPGYPNDAEHPDLALLDAKLNAMFEECRSLDVPVMAHSDESMGRLPSHNKLGGPSGWEAFYREPGNRAARINLGHLGGESGGGSRGNWSADFVQMMGQADNLYGDLGFWDGLVEGNQQAAERMKSLLGLRLSDTEVAADRLMFGTDWFMLSQKPGWKSYAVRFQHVLKEIGVDDVILEKLFSSNARRLFKL